MSSTKNIAFLVFLGFSLGSFPVCKASWGKAAIGGGVCATAAGLFEYFRRGEKKLKEELEAVRLAIGQAHARFKTMGIDEKEVKARCAVLALEAKNLEAQLTKQLWLKRAVLLASALGGGYAAFQGISSLKGLLSSKRSIEEIDLLSGEQDSGEPNVPVETTPSGETVSTGETDVPVENGGSGCDILSQFKAGTNLNDGNRGSLSERIVADDQDGDNVELDSSSQGTGEIEDSIPLRNENIDLTSGDQNPVETSVPVETDVPVENSEPEIDIQHQLKSGTNLDGGESVSLPERIVVDDQDGDKVELSSSSEDLGEADDYFTLRTGQDEIKETVYLRNVESSEETQSVEQKVVKPIELVEVKTENVEDDVANVTTEDESGEPKKLEVSDFVDPDQLVENAKVVELEPVEEKKPEKKAGVFSRMGGAVGGFFSGMGSKVKNAVANRVTGVKNMVVGNDEYYDELYGEDE